MNRGYWKFWRLIQDERLIEQPFLLATWIYCMNNASHNRYTYPDGNIVDPGQLITSRTKVAAGTGQSEKQARLSLEKLQRGGKITLEGARGRYTRVIINDWDLYQSDKDPRAMEGPDEGQVRSKSRPYEGQSRAITNHSHSNTHTHPNMRRSEPSDGIADLSSQVVEYLNEKTDQSFRRSAKSTQDLIATLTDAGYTLEDMKSVIDGRADAWLSSPEMVTNLKPNTLFRLANFESYLGGRTFPEDAAAKELEATEAAAEMERDRRRLFDETEGVPWYELLAFIQEQTGSRYHAEDEQEALLHLRALVERGYSTDDLKQLIRVSTAAWIEKMQTERIGSPYWYYREESVRSWLKWSIKMGRPVTDVGLQHLHDFGVSVSEVRPAINETDKVLTLDATSSRATR